MKPVNIKIIRDREDPGYPEIHVEYDNGTSELIDVADSEAEAKYLVSEYRISYRLNNVPD